MYGHFRLLIKQKCYGTKITSKYNDIRVKELNSIITTPFHHI